MFIRPVLDPRSEDPDARLLIRDPLTMQFLPAAGEEKPVSDYWMRLLHLDQSVEVIEAAAEAVADELEPAPQAPSAVDHGEGA